MSSSETKDYIRWFSHSYKPEITKRSPLHKIRQSRAADQYDMEDLMDPPSPVEKIRFYSEVPYNRKPNFFDLSRETSKLQRIVEIINDDF